MTPTTPDDQFEPVEIESAELSMPESGRAASMTLRQDGGEDPGGGLMDPAHQSLHDALRITLRLVHVSMLVLGVWFMLSGARTVNEGEAGVRLRFGAIADRDLGPGFHLSWPYPMGDLLKIQTGSTTMSDDETFWPFLTADQRQMSLEEIGGRNSLDPGRDGTVITADGNLAHTQYRVNYRRTAESAGDYIENINPQFEDAIIRALSQRAVVLSCAEVTIDQLLKQSSGGSSSIESRAKNRLQDSLERLHAGITVDGFVLVQTVAPLAAKADFAAVQAAESRASQTREEAREHAERVLNQAAGAAYHDLTDLIDDYEVAIEAHSGALADKDSAAAEEWIATQDRLLDEINELLDPGLDAAPARVLVGGNVARLIAESREYKSTVVSQRRSELRRFNARLAQFEQNPLVTVHRDWSDALAELVSKENVEQYFSPLGTGVLEMVINRDPDIARDLEAYEKRRIFERTAAEREQRRKDARFRTDTSIIEVDSGG